MEDIDRNHTPQRKSISVLAKVKEKAKKWRHSLTSSKKKHSHDNNSNTNTTPSWGVTLDDEDDEDPQHLGAPLYESEIGPQTSKPPRVVSVTLDRSHNVLVSPSTFGNNITNAQASLLPKPNNITNVQVSPDDSSKLHRVGSPVSTPAQTSQGPSPNKHLQGNCPGSAPAPTNNDTSPKDAKTMSKTLAEKAFATVSDATYVLASKLQSLALSSHETVKPQAPTPKSAPAKVSLSPRVKSSHPFMSKSNSSRERELVAPALPTIATKQKSTERGKTSPSSAPAAVEASAYQESANKQLSDKGVSVKEYIMQKLEPGEDEKALSRVISKAMSPKKDDNDATVVEKVREAVTCLLQDQQSSPQPNHSTYHSAQNSSAHIPPVIVTDEATEAENLERLLQSN